MTRATGRSRFFLFKLKNFLRIFVINANWWNGIKALRDVDCVRWHEAETCHQQERRALGFCPIGEEFCDVLSNQSGPNAGGMGLVGWHRRTSGSGLRYVFQYRVESTSCRISAGKAVDFFISFSLTTCYCQHIEILVEYDDDHHFSRNEPWCQKQFQVKEAKKASVEEQKKWDANKPLS